MDTGIGPPPVPEPIIIRPIQELRDITESYYRDKIEKEDQLSEEEEVRQEKLLSREKLLIRRERESESGRAILPDDMAVKVDLLA